MDNRTIEEIRCNETKLIKEIEQLEAIIKNTIKDIETFKNDVKEYQEQDRINHQNISIGLVGVRLKTFLKDLQGEFNEK